MNQDNTPAEITPMIDDQITQDVDAAWILSRVISILYFLEYQFGEESSIVIEQVGKQIESNIRNGEDNES